MLLGSFWIILSWSHLNCWIMRQHSWLELKSVSFRHKSIKESSFALTFNISSILLFAIVARSRIFIEVFFQLNFCIKPSLFGTKLLLFLSFWTCISKRRERGVGWKGRSSVYGPILAILVGALSSLKDPGCGTTCREWLLLIDQYPLTLAWYRA